MSAASGRFDGCGPAAVVADGVDHGLREIDHATGRVVGLKYWRASKTLPADLLEMLPPPQLGAAAV